MKEKKINVGGQAVIEGVMIRGPTKYTVAVRQPNGKIALKKDRVKKKRPSYHKWPFIRGFVNLAEMMVIGIKSLMWSAEKSGQEDEKLGKNELTFTLLLSILMVIAFFIALPYFLTNLVGYAEEESPVMFNLVDGLIRIIIFLIYIYGISFMADVKILFRYHGAEHMAIHAYEHGKKLTVENVKKFTTLHPRCGTSFLLIVFIVSILVFSILPSVLIHFYPDFNSLNHWARKGILFPIRIILIPAVAGISYEILKLSDKKQDTFLFKMISLPGLGLQKITTQKPTKKQIEVAIKSLKELLDYEKRK